MELNAEAVVSLNWEEVQKILNDYMSKKGYDVLNMKVNVSTRTSGYPMDTYEVPYFKDIEVKIKL